MKKILLIIIMIMFVSGCGPSKEITKEKIIYNDMINKLSKADSEDYNHPLPYDINVYIDKIIDSEVRYQVIVDNPTKKLKNISAIVTHNYPTKDIFPSIGVFDDKVNLYPNYVDTENNYAKGISLTGYIPFEKDLSEFYGVFKVLVEYDDESGAHYTNYYEYQN